MCGTTTLFPLPYSSRFITIASIQVARVMVGIGSISIALDSSLMIRTSPFSVLFIRWIVAELRIVAIFLQAAMISGFRSSGV